MSLFDLPEPAAPPEPVDSPPMGCQVCGGSFGHYRHCTETARARTSDPETSHAAAESISSERLRKGQTIVLDLLAELGPMADDELVQFVTERGLPLSPSGARTRRSELVALGLVEDSGVRVRTVSGRAAIVWRAIPT